jgi:formylglycine-generating enzyme required for sulfatase activity
MSTATRAPVERMTRIEGGTFAMGSEQFYADEGPVHEVTVGPFTIDRYLVTNRQFAGFVDATGYVTTAERRLSEQEFPDLAPDERAGGSLVFRQTDGPVNLRDWRQWWEWRVGADWRHPFGAGSSIELMAGHPVVQVSYEDANSYAAWAGKRLLTEQEWEFAARGGLEGATYAWGEELHPNDELMANTWQGAFPWQNTGSHGWVGTSPVGSFPANGYGLFDMIGNVWEWTSSPYSSRRDVEAACCSPSAHASPGEARRVLKGGSHLCAPEYCLRYRPAARSPQSDDTSTTHIGFRCAAN